jgi:hypothetical protein
MQYGILRLKDYRAQENRLPNTPPPPPVEGRTYFEVIQTLNS